MKKTGKIAVTKLVTVKSIVKDMQAILSEVNEIKINDNILYDILTEDLCKEYHSIKDNTTRYDGQDHQDFSNDVDFNKSQFLNELLLKNNIIDQDDNILI